MQITKPRFLKVGQQRSTWTHSRSLLGQGKVDAPSRCF